MVTYDDWKAREDVSLEQYEAERRLREVQGEIAELEELGWAVDEELLDAEEELLDYLQGR